MQVSKGQPTIDTSEAFKVLEEKIQVARDLLSPTGKTLNIML